MAWGTTILLDMNTGQSVFIRYAVWAGAPLIVYLTINLIKFKKWILIALCLISVQVFDSYINRKYYPEQEYLNLNKLSKIVLNNFPSIYNPEPEIFIERVLGKEIVKGSVAVVVNNPVVYKDEEGFIRKIAFRKTAIPIFDNSVCGANKKLANFDHSYPNLSKAYKASNGYFYLSGKFLCN